MFRKCSKIVQMCSLSYQYHHTQHRVVKFANYNFNKFEFPKFLYTTCLKNQNAEHSGDAPNLNRERKIKVLEMEMEVSRQEGRKAPNPASLKDEHWEYLLALNSRSARRKYYTYLWQIEKKKESKQVKKEIKKEEIAVRKAREREEAEENNHIIYGLGHTGFLLRVYDTTINLWNNNKLIQAIQFGQKLVFDCSYDNDMTHREAVNTAKQMMISFAENRFHDEPYDLHFCNTNMNQTTIKYLHKHIPTMFESSFPMNIHETCFTKLFPKERLVYLTPHCRNDLNTFNHDDIYIIGCIVDKVNSEPLSLAKAKKLGLRMARLPLDKYLNWGQGSGKSLTLNQMMSIMLDIKKTGDWNYALRHVPKRKVVTENSQQRYTEKPRNRSKTNPFRSNINIEE